MKTRLVQKGCGVAAGVVVVGASCALGWPTALAAPSHTVVAQRQSVELVVDTAGVLSASEQQSITSTLEQLRAEKQKVLFIRYDLTFPVQGSDYAKQFFDGVSGDNVAVITIATESRDYGYYAGSQWSQSEIKKVLDAGLPLLSQSSPQWAEAGQAFADTALHGDELSGESAAWLGAGAVAVVGTGGGIWYASKRRRRKEQSAQLDSARGFAADDRNRFDSLDTPVLEQLAEEELVSTDESIRRGEEELALATSEFGPARTRPFVQAVEASKRTLHEAFDHKQALERHRMNEQQRRDTLIRIITSCGKADDILDARAADFARMRNIVLNAPEHLTELTQRTVDLHARLPRATEQLEELRQRFSARALGSISDNAEIAHKHLLEAETRIDSARATTQRAAGEQQGLADEISTAEKLLDQANQLLSGIEHADANISAARANVDALLDEVDGGIGEADALKQRNQRNGLRADWQKLDQVVAEARTVLERARRDKHEDPLGAYSALSEIDAALDEQLDELRETTRNREELLHRVDSTIATAQRMLQSAEDLIATRGRIIGVQARSLLVEGQQLYAEAQQLRTRDPERSLVAARKAHSTARRALDAARGEIDDYTRRNNSGSGTGAFLAGMVINELLSGNSRGGGFGGGFGGGDFGGGSFGGGGFGGGGKF